MISRTISQMEIFFLINIYIYDISGSYDRVERLAQTST